jgi:hypothetical protein
MSEHSVYLKQVTPDVARRALSAAAEEWGARFEPLGPGGQLELPVVAALKRGLLTGPVVIEARGEGSQIVFRPPTEQYALNVPAFALVLSAALGAILVIAWPLYPRLLPLAPLGAILAIAGWFQVARHQHRAPADFMRRVETHAVVVLEGEVLPPEGEAGPGFA